MRKLLVFGAVLVIAGCGKTPASGPQNDGTEKAAAEAQFKGRTVSQWAQQLRDRDAATRTEAAEALKAIGAEAKSALGELKLAIKDRAWELLLTHLGTNANGTFTAVGNTIGKGKPREPTKDEIIADLRRELEQKRRELADHRRQVDAILDDPCLRALILALAAIDPREVEAIAHAPAAQAQTTFTFTTVGTKVGSTTGK